jgi:hypothetical protein
MREKGRVATAPGPFASMAAQLVQLPGKLYPLPGNFCRTLPARIAGRFRPRCGNPRSFSSPLAAWRENQT